jgi:hypothetical protein
MVTQVSGMTLKDARRGKSVQMWNILKAEKPST